jgi:hypothetical protein
MRYDDPSVHSEADAPRYRSDQRSPIVAGWRGRWAVARATARAREERAGLRHVVARTAQRVGARPPTGAPVPRRQSDDLMRGNRSNRLQSKRAWRHAHSPYGMVRCPGVPSSEVATATGRRQCGRCTLRFRCRAPNVTNHPPPERRSRGGNRKRTLWRSAAFVCWAGSYVVSVCARKNNNPRSRPDHESRFPDDSHLD